MCYQYLRLIGGVEANFASTLCIASTASVMPMNRGIQGAGGSVEAKMMKTVMKKQQLS